MRSVGRRSMLVNNDNAMPVRKIIFVFLPVILEACVLR
jgi:hypothetical protein